MARPLSESIEAGWAEALEPVADTVAAMGDFLRAEVAAGRKYLPAGANVLRAFQQPLRRRAGAGRWARTRTRRRVTPWAVVLGGPGRAPAAEEPAEHLPRVPERPRASGADHRRPHALGRAGVLMLNRVLTVEPGAPGLPPEQGLGEGHRGGRAGARAAPGPAAGRGAVGAGRPDGEAAAGDEVPTVESAHPSPMSADRGFFGSRPFSRVDEHLAELGDEPVDWRLP